MSIRSTGIALVISTMLLMAGSSSAQTAPPQGAASAEQRLFAIVVTTGSGWDASKPPNEQAYFAEHSANLRRLRERGHIRFGARYADKGLIVVSAASEADARRMMDDDPSIAAGTFMFEVHSFHVFYPGSVEAS